MQSDRMPAMGSGRTCREVTNEERLATQHTPRTGLVHSINGLRAICCGSVIGTGLRCRAPSLWRKVIGMPCNPAIQFGNLFP